MEQTKLIEKLHQCTKEELIEIILNVYSENMDIYLKNNDSLDKIKLKLDEMFFPRIGVPVLNLEKTEMVIQSFKEECNDTELNFELNLYYVESLLEFIKTYGAMSEQFYGTMYSYFKNCTSYLKDNPNPESLDRLEYIVNNMSLIYPDYYLKMKDCLKEMA